MSESDVDIKPHLQLEQDTEIFRFGLQANHVNKGPLFWK